MERLVRKFHAKRTEITQAFNLKFGGTMRDPYTGDIYTAEEVNEARKFGEYFDAVMLSGPIPIDRPESFRRQAAHIIRDNSQPTHKAPQPPIIPRSDK